MAYSNVQYAVYVQKKDTYVGGSNESWTSVQDITRTSFRAHGPWFKDVFWFTIGGG